MELILFFALSAVSQFSINFERSYEPHHQYFLFEDNSSSISLFSDEDTISLSLSYLDEYSLYQLNCTDERFQFQWPYYINEQLMTLQRGYQIDKVFDSMSDSHSKNSEDIADNDNTIYQYIMGAVLIAFLLIESPEVFRRVATRLNQRSTEQN